MIKISNRKSATLIGAALLALCLLPAGPARSTAPDPGPDPGPAPLTRLRSEGGRLIDGYGRVTLLRGANVPSHCYKPMKFNDADLTVLAGFGFNFIRLGISWDKAEPEPGQYDLAYLDSLVEFARRAGERGIYVMPEVHKYGWCQPGSDWPMWSCDPAVKDGGDFTGMMKNARRFWNSPELQDKLIAFWKIIIVRFRDLDNVIGYNPMNEPLDLSMMIPGAFEPKLFAFYELWIAAARELDPLRPACLEPSTVNMIVPFKPPPFNHQNLVYAPHPYYVHGDGFIEPESRRGLEKKYRRIAREAKALGAPLLVGEYGGDPDTAFARRWLTDSLELQDQYFAGAAIWVYDPSNTGWAITDADNQPKPFFEQTLNRPYPRSTAGLPLELSYDVAVRSFRYRYQPDPAITAPTEIYLPGDLARGHISVEGGSWSQPGPAGVIAVSTSPGSREILVEASPGP